MRLMLCLAEVQSNGSQIRILAHLIRLPDQTHVWVVRKEPARSRTRWPSNPELAQKIAAEFTTPRVSRSLPTEDASLPAASHLIPEQIRPHIFLSWPHAAISPTCASRTLEHPSRV